MKAIDQYNFFQNIKLNNDGYIECVLVDYVAPSEDGISQYDTYLRINFDDDDNLIITEPT